MSHFNVSIILTEISSAWNVLEKKNGLELIDNYVRIVPVKFHC